MSFSKLSVFFISKLHLSYFCQIIPKLFRRFEAYFCYYFVEGFSVSYLYYIHRILVRLFPNYSDDLIGFYVTPPHPPKKNNNKTPKYYTAVQNRLRANKSGLQAKTEGHTFIIYHYRNARFTVLFEPDAIDTCTTPYMNGLKDKDSDIFE